MTLKAIQDNYPDHVSHCYGCGRLNEHGLQIKSYQENDQAVCTVTPQAYHISFPGTVYGGLIAAVIECHSMATAVAAVYHAAGREIGTEPRPGFLVASLRVRFVKRTPAGVPLVLRAPLPRVEGRRLLVRSTLSAQEQLCANGEALIVQVSEGRMLGAA